MNHVPKQLAEIGEKLKTQHLKRGDFLLRAGDVCRVFRFIQYGCLRYDLPAEVETTVRIAFPNDLGSDFQRFLSGRPSRFYIQAIDDADLYCLSRLIYGSSCAKKRDV